MFNSYLYNAGLFGSNGVLDAPASMGSTIEFNGYSLQSANIITQTLKSDSMPARNLSVARNARSHGGIILNDSQELKLIRLSGFIKADTAAELETLLDEIKKNIVGLEGDLDIMNAANIAKRHVATLINGDNIFERRVGWHITICPFDFTFACYVPFGKSLSYNADALFAETSLDKDETIIVGGTYEADGVLIFVFNTAVAVTGLTFTNATRGEAITITEPISAGGILKIDCENKQVTLNGTAIDYDGVFPVFDVGSNSYNVTITGTSATWDLTLKYKTTYL